MKVAYKATTKRSFKFHWVPFFIGIGYDKQYFHYDKWSCQQFVTIFLPFCHITATQYFRKFDNHDTTEIH